jgi:hypothetical protein
MLPRGQSRVVRRSDTEAAMLDAARVDQVHDGCGPTAEALDG